MKDFVSQWLVNTAALWFVVWIMPGIDTADSASLLVASLVLGLLNTFIKPVVTLFTLPLQILSLGVVTLLINGFFFFLLDKLVDGFFIASYWSAFWGALFFSIISFIFNAFFLSKNRVHVRYNQHQPTQRVKRPSQEDVIDVEGHARDN